MSYSSNQGIVDALNVGGDTTVSELIASKNIINWETLNKAGYSSTNSVSTTTQIHIRVEDWAIRNKQIFIVYNPNLTGGELNNQPILLTGEKIWHTRIENGFDIIINDENLIQGTKGDDYTLLYNLTEMDKMYVYYLNDKTVSDNKVLRELQGLSMANNDSYANGYIINNMNGGFIIDPISNGNNAFITVLKTALPFTINPNECITGLFIGQNIDGNDEIHTITGNGDASPIWEVMIFNKAGDPLRYAFRISDKNGMTEGAKDYFNSYGVLYNALVLNTFKLFIAEPQKQFRISQLLEQMSNDGTILADQTTALSTNTTLTTLYGMLQGATEDGTGIYSLDTLGTRITLAKESTVSKGLTAPTYNATIHTDLADNDVVIFTGGNYYHLIMRNTDSVNSCTYKINGGLTTITLPANMTEPKEIHNVLITELRIVSIPAGINGVEIEYY